MSYFDDASLVMIPSGYKDQKVYSVKPIDGSGDLTFSRASNATRVNSSGLVEKVRTNLLLHSNSFDTTWVNTRSTDTSGQAGYDGTNNAWLLESTASPANEAYIRQTIIASGSNTFSIYAKAGTSNFLGVYINAISGTDPSAYFNLSTGAVGTTSASATASIVSVGSGWYRCSIAYNATIANIDIYVTDADGSFISTSGANILIQASQLETGDIATDYIATTSAAVSVGPVSGLPRLDYSGGASCPSLLLEPQRTNIVPNSEQFDNATWSNNGTLVANQGVSPDGYTNADLFYSTTGTGKRIFDAVTITSATTYTSSVFAKAAGKSFIYFPDIDNLTSSVWFNLSNGTFSTPIEGTAIMVDYGNGWYRCSLTTTSTTTTGYSYVGISDASGSTTFTQNGTDGVLIWGAQVEAGAYATSYIPTLSSAGTRFADSASKTGISSLIGQTEGVLFADFIMPPSGTLFTHYRISGTGGLYNNSQSITLTATNQVRGYSFSAGGVQAQIDSGTYAEGTRVKVAYAYKANDFVLYVNGVQIGTDTSGTVPAMSELLVGSYYPDTSLNVVNKTNQVLLFKTRLSNSDLATLTTL